MAKKRRTKRKNKKILNQLSDTFLIRIIGLTVVFLTIISLFNLGLVGIALNSGMMFLFGSFSYAVDAILFGYGLYLVYRGKQIHYLELKTIGFLVALIAVLILVAIPSNLEGLATISSYLTGDVTSNGGLVGVALFSFFGVLFDAVGTVVFAVVLLLIGIGIVAGKSLVEYQSRVTQRANMLKQSVQKSREKKKMSQKSKENLVKMNEKMIKDFESKNEPAKGDQTGEIPVALPLAQEPSYTKFEQNTEKGLNVSIKEANLQSDDSGEDEQPIFSSIPSKANVNYKLPPLSLLNTVKNQNSGRNRELALKNADRLTEVLREFGVKATVSDIFIGPAVTKFELTLEPGTRVNKITSLHDDIKLALATKEIRIEAPIPGKAAIGIEVANDVSAMVSFKDVLKDIPVAMRSKKLLVGLGKDITGKSIFMELNKTPHLLVAGATGSGKSVCINTIICSILMRATPDEVKLILVDPKKVELSIYNDIPHLLSKVVTDPKKAAAVLHELVAEMELRYDMFLSCNARNIESYNEYVSRGVIKDKEKMPYIVVILDEVADLMMVASKDVEDCIMRISQKARAAGIHMILATQRPSTDIITGVIKANIPSRIAFAVSSSIDSRTILDTGGAEKLLGKGDMLLSLQSSSSLTRLQGCFVSDSEVKAIADFTREQQEAQYIEKFDQVKVTTENKKTEDSDDEDYEKCKDFVIQVQKASTSLLQRHFRIGYNKAARIIDRLEAEGIIGPQMGSKPREVYIRANVPEN